MVVGIRLEPALKLTLRGFGVLNRLLVVPELDL
jgi:hypothetical protein